jgi:hypothetical protein
MATNRRSAAKGKAKAPPRNRSAPPLGLTLDRQFDLLGLALLALAVVALLSYLSPEQGLLTRPLLDLLRRAFGWGETIATLGLGALGLWLLLRRFGDHLPRIRPERLVGLVLTYVVTLVTLSAAGEDGGALGALLANALLSLGEVAATLVLLVAWLAGLVLLFRISPVVVARNTFRLGYALTSLAAQWWQTRKRRKAQQSAHAATPPGTESQPAENRPLPKREQRLLEALSAAPQAASSALPGIDDILDAVPEGAVDVDTNWHRAQVIAETLEAFSTRR